MNDIIGTIRTAESYINTLLKWIIDNDSRREISVGMEKQKRPATADFE